MSVAESNRLLDMVSAIATKMEVFLTNRQLLIKFIILFIELTKVLVEFITPFISITFVI